MEGDKYLTIHGVLLWKRKLFDHCEIALNDTPVICILKRKVKELIFEKWQERNSEKKATKLTKDDNQLQQVLQCVEHHRKSNDMTKKLHFSSH